MTVEPNQLLASFVKEGSESAFRELVSRYVDLVYSTAVRLVDGDTHRAQDISQIVFADLARMAGRLSEGVALGGWLHRHTCFVARTTMRGERRRQARERQAAQMNALNEADAFLQFSPVLDEAIQELGPDDRDAILLRFFERRSLRSVGEALGTNENVAQKRVSRAVQELGLLLQRRGVALSAGAIATLLAAGAVKAAPIGLGLSIAATVLASSGAVSGPALTATKVALTAKVKFAVLGALITVGVLTGLVLYNRSTARPGTDRVAGQVSVGNSSPAVQAETDTANQSLSKPAAEVRLRISPETNLAVANSTTENDSNTPEETPLRTPNVPAAVAVPARSAARSGSWLKIEGTSNIHDWQVVSSIIGGSLLFGPEFPLDSMRNLEPGLVQARADVFVPVRSLKSIDNHGDPYSDKMDEVMYEALKERQNQKIHFWLSEMRLKGSSNFPGGLRYEVETRGDLAVAGVTNELVMAVWMMPLGNGKFRISGSTPLKMQAFGIQPPSLGMSSGVIQTGDDITVSFEWLITAQRDPSPKSLSGLIELVLDLPQPAFASVPPDLLRRSRDLEPLSKSPRAPIRVPTGLLNLAPGALLSSSDKNAFPEDLARVVDGDKEGSDPGVVYLGKGVQWVQLDFGGPREIFAIVLWHAHHSPKIYHAVVVQSSSDAGFHSSVRTLFNNDRENSCGLGAGKDREYVETYEGKLINGGGTKARYLRFYSKGSTESALNEYTEIEVYGKPVP